MAMAASAGYFAIGFRSIQIIQVRLRKPDYKPPFIKAKKIPREDAGYRVTDGNIAAIDFGTTSVSIAFITKGDEKVTTLTLDREDQSTRVPNAVLLKKEDDGKMKVVAFGSIARKKFTSMRSSEHHTHVYFERIKMLMRREKAVDRDTVVESFSGDKFYLVEVIAFILKYLKDLLINHFSCTVKPLKTTDFDWVITVPAIWDARGKRMMREAAYLAGLLTEYGSINKFTPVSYRSLPLPNEVNPDKLSLALEPESAALYSQETVGDQIESDPATSIIPRPSDYMVIDAGGGTIDITAHIEADGSIVVENIPTGNAWGGTQINEAFSKILEGIANDPGFEKFLASGDRSQNMADIIKIFYTEFESEKLLFGKEQTEEIRISLPSRFVRFHDKNLQAGIKKRSGIDYEDDMLYISKEVVESELFGPALNGIIECTLQAIKSNDNDLSTFYLVGGFGGCKYVHKKVKAAIDKSFHGQGRSCNVIVPPTPQLAVATGAAIWRKNPEKIKARRSDATYGIGATQSFEDDKHDEYYKFYNEEQEKYKCDSIFSVFLEKGELAKSDEVITASSRPSRQRNTTMKLQIYSTPDLGIQYIKDKNGKSTVTKIGQIVIDIPNPDNLPREKRLVDVTMDFSGTEIQAKAKYRVTGEEVKTVCDFLSAQQT
ncbi:PREDICTED: heat shock 70 kDa protein 12A-like [Amphimedon queenslandica]|uniref:Uncharacterized protein n=2 Tax=Amphimedon queenslandica TaxID=400682 RepID=A0AAN0IR95_AMPQE|nr:PREDICTED: heat shock 70 kDa protein 12A-like [Amphimedon queenslandica]|eukprot:XP_011406945.1 PREDICTED: heat shock 70 kDa protein 12A-like [Amphimedon queenslandica]